jgi:hypothetical protein
MTHSQIAQDDYKQLNHTITIKPDSVSDSLTDADDIQWFLTTSPDLGEGRSVLDKTIADITVVDGETFEIELTPSETRELAPNLYFPEVTIVWDSGDKPSTTRVEPNIRVTESEYDSTT